MGRILLFFCFSLIGCNKSVGNYAKLELKSKQILEIPLDENTSSAWWTLQYLDLGTEEFLVFHDQIKSNVKKIHFSHLKDQKKSFQVDVAIEGPNGVGHLDGFHVKSLDSIFVLNQYAYKLYLIDTSGRVKDMFPLLGDNFHGDSEITYLPSPFPWSPIVDLGNQLFFPASPDVNPLKNFKYKSFKSGILLDLINKEFNYQLDYPDSYYNSGFWGLQLEIPSQTVNFKDSILIQSFPIEDRVMVYDFDLNLIDSPTLFKEYYEGKFHSLPEPSNEPDLLYPHIFSNPSNKSILFDPYRDLYYRIYSAPYSEDMIERRRTNNFVPSTENKEYPDRKIMVFDRKFNEIGIIELDKEKYWVEFIRIVKEGILIPVQSDDEDKKIFEIFEVKY